MAYVVNNSRGQLIAVIPDGTVNTDATSQTLIGKNVTPYGAVEVENLVHQLENFANATAPGNPIEGQLWFNTSTNVLSVSTASSWKTVSGQTASSTPPTSGVVPGDLWFDTTASQLKVYATTSTGFAWLNTNNVQVSSSAPSAPAVGQMYFNSGSDQLFVWDGLAWSLIGPDGVLGFGVTKWVSASLLDTGAETHAVMLGTVDGTVVSIVSADTFTISANVAPPGFSEILPGINLGTSVALNGRATTASALYTPRYINGVLFDGTQNITLGVAGALSAGSGLVGNTFTGISNVSFSVDGTSSNTPNKVVIRDSLGDFSARVITADLIGTVTGNATNVNGLVKFNNGGTGFTFYNDGQILLGSSTTGLVKGSVVGSSPITVSNVGNTITIGYTGGIGTGNVTSVGITPGAGIGVSGSPITSAGSITVTNTGVTQLNAGSGVSVNNVNGNVTLTNTGVTKLTSGGGLSLDSSNGNITLTNTGVRSITAGTNVTITGSNGNFTINSAGAVGTPGVTSITGGTGIGVNTSTGAVILTNTGVTAIQAGNNVSVSSANGVVTINSLGANGTPGVTSITGSTGIGVSNSTGAVTLTNTGVTAIQAGNNVSISSTNGVVTINATAGTSGVSKIIAGTNVTISPTNGTGAVTISASGGSNATGTVTQIVAGVGLTGGTITTSGTLGVDSSVLRSNVVQTISSLKTFTGGVISQAYNFTNTGSSIFYVYETEPVVKIPVNDGAGPYDYTHQFYNKRLVVEGSADRPPGSNRPAGGAIMGIDNGTSGGAGVFGHHTNNQPGIGIGTGAFASNMTFTGAVFQGISSRPASGDFVQIRSYSLLQAVFEVRGNGNVFYAGSVTAPGADYAEYFEWLDGNTSNEDRVGLSVTLDGNKVRQAGAGDNVLGVVSANPSIVGDGAELGWVNMYQRDSLGRVLTEEYHVYNWTDHKGNLQSVASFEDLSSVPKSAKKVTVDGLGNQLVRQLLNPAYNKDIKYIPRSKRPEWSPIGLMGKLRVRKGQIIGSGWIKLRDIDEYVEEWLVK